MSNPTRKLEKIIKPVVLIAALLGLLTFGFCQETKADVRAEIGPAIASGEYTNGGVLRLSQDFGKFNIGLGYISEQDIEDRSGRVFPTKPNLYLDVVRTVDIYKKWRGGVGVAFFNNTNRALGCRTTATLAIGYEFSDRVGMYLRHYSNAGSCTPNMGQDLLTIQYRFGRR